MCNLSNKQLATSGGFKVLAAVARPAQGQEFPRDGRRRSERVRGLIIQSPFFLAYQEARQPACRQNNAQSFFHLEQIPSDNQIRQMLDLACREHLIAKTHEEIAAPEFKDELIDPNEAARRNKLIRKRQSTSASVSRNPSPHSLLDQKSPQLSGCSLTAIQNLGAAFGLWSPVTDGNLLP